jgi:group I intron endonuclease
MNSYSDGKWTLYCHINKINGKKYIGITSKKNPNSRWRYGFGYADTPHFWRAIQKYGWKNFEHLILSTNLTKQEACELEIYFIKELKLQNDQYGYNIGNGGESGSLKGKLHPMYGKHHTDEAKEKNRQAHLGKVVYVSKEARERAAAKQRGVPRNKGTKVRCVETKKEYPTATAAQRDTGADASAIIKCIKGKLSQTHGLHWEAI